MDAPIAALCRILGHPVGPLPVAEHQEREMFRQSKVNNGYAPDIWSGQPVRPGCRRLCEGKVGIA